MKKNVSKYSLGISNQSRTWVQACDLGRFTYSLPRTLKMDDKSRSAFTKWLLTEKTGRQSCMIARSYGEKIIQYLREKRERGEDDADLKTKYDTTFRLSIKKRNFKLLNAVGLGDILCLPVKKVCVQRGSGNF